MPAAPRFAMKASSDSLKLFWPRSALMVPVEYFVVISAEIAFGCAECHGLDAAAGLGAQFDAQVAAIADRPYIGDPVTRQGQDRRGMVIP